MSVFPTQAEIRGPLLEWAQDALGHGRYTTPPTAMTPGNDTQVYALALEGLDLPLVLRVFRRGSDPRRPIFESAIQNGLAGQGLPAARALGACADPGVIGAPFFVMERLPGVPLYGDAIDLGADGLPRASWRRILQQGEGPVLDLPRMLADVDLRIHSAATKPVKDAIAEAGLHWQDLTLDGRLLALGERVAECQLDGLRAGVDWLQKHRPESRSEDVVCHGDMQPLNLLMRGGQLTGILDWANATLGPPEFEIGWTRAIYLTIDLSPPGPLRLLEKPLGELLIRRYTHCYERARPIDRSTLAYFEAFRSLSGLGMLGEMVVRGEEIRDAWNSRSAIDRVVRHVRTRTGVGVSIPWVG